MKISVRIDLYVTNNDRMRHATMALRPRVTNRREFDDKGKGQISAIVTEKSLASTGKSQREELWQLCSMTCFSVLSPQSI